VLDWSQVEQAIAGETRPRERAILISLRVPRRFHVRGKGNKDRVVVLTRLGAQALAKYLETRATALADAALFVTAAGRPITHRAVTRAVRRAGRRLAVQHPHMFRHSDATELLERGADVRNIRTFAMPGHESVATTEIYTHVSAARRRRVVQLLEAPGIQEVLLSPPA
jgi:integrase/recombinase XerC